ADSSFIGSNSDAAIFIGAFQEGTNVLAGDIAEIVLYKKILAKEERQQLEYYFFNKYAIPQPPAPDSIYTSIPRHLQFYSRDADDSATVNIAGHIYEAGYDSIYLNFFKNNILISHISEPLVYES